MSALWECACFALRTLGAKDQQQSMYVTISTLLFLLAPLCKCALSQFPPSSNSFPPSFKKRRKKKESPPPS